MNTDGYQGNPEVRLESWKEIAAYLRRDVRTVQRWERQEGLPVHRHVHDRQASVFAYVRELDEWRTQRERTARIPDEGRRERTESQAALSPPGPEASPVPRSTDIHKRSRHSRRLWWVVFGFALTISVAIGRYVGRKSGPHHPKRLSVPTIRGTEPFHLGVAVSADGTRLAYSASASGRLHIQLKFLDRLEPIEVAGSDGGFMPFFSPNGEWVAFATDGKLKRVPVRGGEAQLISDAPNARGGTWGPDGSIVFAPSWQGGLHRIPPSGGEPHVLTTLDHKRGEVSHRWPHFLPDGRTLLFSTMTASVRDEERTIDAFSLESGIRKTLVYGGTHPRYLRTGHLLYAQDGRLMMAPFDTRRLELLGPSMPVLSGVLMSRKGSGQAVYDVSDAGSLIYVPKDERPPKRTLLWVDRDGRAEVLAEATQRYSNPTLSPDGRMLAVTIDGSTDDIWIYDLVGKVWTRFTSRGDNGDPVWTSDSRRLVFSSAMGGQWSIFCAPFSVPGAAELLVKGPGWSFPTSVSGRTVAFTSFSPQTRYDIGTVDLQDRQPVGVLSTSFEEGHAVFSPDGLWFAYTSDESGQVEIYVRPRTGAGPARPISQGPGTHPLWSRSGREIFYRNGAEMFVVRVQADSHAFHAGRPKRLFAATFEPSLDTSNRRSYDVTSDGRRFVMIKADPNESALLQVVVIPDWADEIRALLHRSQ